MDIIVGKEYGIDFKDDKGNVISEYICTEDEQQRLATQWADGDDNDVFPNAAVIATTWQRNVTRKAIYGVDYGPGSVKRRFGGGHTPKGAYQFRG